MPWAELLQKIGMGGILTIILLPFWKADDMIAEHARRDISGYLLRIDDQIKLNFRVVFNSLFDNFYGKGIITARSISITSAISFSIVVLFMIAYFDPEHELNWQMKPMRLESDGEYLFNSSYAATSVLTIVTLNIILDFCQYQNLDY